MYARLLLVAATLTLSCAAQSVISAKSGTLHYFTGQVSIDGVDKQMKPGVFPMVKPESILRTEVGQAEMLLTPGVFLRVNYHSAIRMLDADLEKTRIEVMSGSVMVEADDPRLSVKNAPVALLVGAAEIRLVKYGLVRISAEGNLIKVYRGEAEVTSETTKLLLKAGQRSALSGDLRAEKFVVRNDSDELMAWSAQRSADLSAANLLAAGTVRTGRGYRSEADQSWNGGWYYSSTFGFFTFVPLRGTAWNPWGYGFYSPGTIFGANGISAEAFRSVVVSENGSAERNGGRGSRPPGIGRPTGEGELPVANPTLSSEARHAFAGAASDVAAGHRMSSEGAYRGGTFRGDNAGSFGNRNTNEGLNTFPGAGLGGTSQAAGGRAGGGGGNMSGGGNGGGGNGGGARAQRQQ